ncbi:MULTISPECIES: homoprotocatechuate degradation operon regulator HpaR [Ralstonia solanacearum species complex]|uniref:Homoprotocatechuate degradation operon regulator HpaR n=4 Tax=Ralstonia solanacearum species complex TaxID=3116862 RepID=A0A0K1ZK59_RALSL|nr:MULTISPECIES: homoprotocatechuate degradation operon regulator HpaR [Ralstonia]AKZ26421.1 MarR family transcriptional regulator [Ralstonia solanacearum]APC68668.1 homoprotocatechuate degradation operon regulator HpaR [Ralstonia solanacearum OE1-1]APF86832.1 homoprotocatechuate degradation operon regulator, HpaR [Ralstonia solanacearum FJAT-1458]ARS56298.1 homoprotocatechuate degradation operon regulator, HpaR [Ralstonia solanacearum FJAT-91]ESS50042.1 transcription regulator protein [Ralsto
MVSTFKRRNLPHLLLRARETLMARFRPILREHGITEQQWRVLRTLNDTGDMEPNQLADACLILSPSLTRMLAAMEQADMIVRTRSSVDQRRQVISLTPKSRRFLADVEPQVDATYANIESQLGRPRLEALYRVIDEAIQLMEAPATDKRLPADD